MGPVGSVVSLQVERPSANMGGVPQQIIVKLKRASAMAAGETLWCCVMQCARCCMRGRPVTSVIFSTVPTLQLTHCPCRCRPCHPHHTHPHPSGNPQCLPTQHTGSSCRSSRSESSHRGCGSSSSCCFCRNDCSIIERHSTACIQSTPPCSCCPPSPLSHQRRCRLRRGPCACTRQGRSPRRQQRD